MTTGRSSIIGVFDDREAAEQTINTLQGAGFSNNQISYATNVRSAGFLESIKHMFSGNDTNLDNLYNDFVRMGLHQDEAAYYTHEYETGHTIVAVQPGARTSEAENILQRNGAHTYRAGAGRTGTTTDATASSVNPARPGMVGTTDATASSAANTSTNAGAPGMAGSTRTDAPFQQQTTQTRDPRQARSADYTQQADNLATDEARSLKLREEQLRAEKERVQSGEVRLRKETVTEQRTINVPVTHEEVIIEQHPVAEGTDVTDTPIGEGETIRVPVSEERVNVTKTPVTTGEVSIQKREVEENREITDTVRREKARIEQQGDVSVNSTWKDQPQADLKNDIDDESTR